MSTTTSRAVTAAEIEQAAEILGRLEPGYLPRPIFDAVARLAVMSVIELVPVRTTAEGHTEVLLTQRAESDPLWPSQWHNPGCVVRPSDAEQTYRDAFRRLLDEELGGAKLSGLPVLVGPMHNFISRGFNNSLIYWAELAEAGPVGSWFDSRKLPENSMVVQGPVIATAVGHYERTRRQTIG